MSRIVNRSISNKVMLVVMATTFIALLAYGASMLIYDLRNYRSALITDLETQSAIVAEVSAAALEFSDPVAAEENIELLRTRPSILRAAIFDIEGERVAEYISAQSQQTFWPERQPRTARSVVAGNRVQVWRPISKNGQQLGTVFIRARYEVYSRFYDSLIILALVMAASMGLALFVATWLRRAITTPILAVTKVARRVMQSRDFSLRADKLTEDEIGILVDAFNDMLSEVERRARALEESNRSLEHEMAERQAAEAALRLADQRKDEFLATLAHELRNPLAPLVNSLQILRNSRKDPQSVVNAQAVIERQLKQMVRLVDDLLDVSRITTGKLHINPSRVDARSVMRDAVETSGGLIEACGHQFSVELPLEGIYINADPLRLAQVFSNLLNNAAKYTNRGGHIEFTSRVVDEEIIFSITDNGIGIAPERFQDVFDMFTQVNQSLERPQAGLGVGLALSKRLVQLHGGELVVNSAGAGCGATFSVCLKVAEAGHAEPEQAAVKPPAQTPPRRVMLVDDNIDFVTTMATLLSALGHQVCVLHDGASALQVAPEFAPEFAFLDIGMPGMNGYDLARKLRQIAEVKDTVLVAATGWGQEKDQALSRQAGFNYHLVKPVELGDVLAIIEGSPLVRANSH